MADNEKDNMLDDDLLDLLEDDVLYDESKEEASEEEASEEELEEGKQKFKDKLDKLLSNKDKHLKKVLKGEDPELAYHVVESMENWDNPEYKDEKFKYREKLAQSYWGLYREMATKVADENFPSEKIQMIKYGLLSKDYITDEQEKILDNIIQENQNKENPSIFLTDEWFRDIAKGEVPPSVLDETATKRRGASKERLGSKKGQMEAEIKSAKLKIEKIQSNEADLKKYIDMIDEHTTHPNFAEEELIEPYQSNQKESLTLIIDATKELLKLDRQLKINYRVIDKIKFEIKNMEKALDKGEEYIDISETVYAEFLSFRQMVKMCAGKQGNHFPILHKSYMSMDMMNIATIANVSKMIDEIEVLDPQLFYRTYKGEDHRIYPYVLIVPSYGNRGICWEPFSRSNRATSKGRIIIPMFPKNLKGAVLAALADLRWQVAKEKAQHYWMEEGLTGYYYEYYTNEKLKGNIKAHFINDYIQWIIWESRGVQKLHKDLRPVFWRFTPFPDDVKESLKNRGFYYQKLYQKDQNRLKSDGY